jgi:NAD(P)H-dependent FMN reductase
MTDSNRRTVSKSSNRDAVAKADAILFTSPAYNGTMPAVAKNAIDVASRPRGAAPIVDKPVLIATATYSPGADERVLEHARVALTIAGAKPMEQGFGVSKHFEAFDESGLATVRLVAPFIPTIPGTDTYTDQLW